MAITTLALLTGTCLAQAGPGGPGGGEEKFDIEAALKRVYKLMRDAEESLTGSLDTEKAAESGRKAKEEILAVTEPFVEAFFRAACRPSDAGCRQGPVAALHEQSQCGFQNRILTGCELDTACDFGFFQHGRSQRN